MTRLRVSLLAREVLNVPSPDEPRDTTEHAKEARFPDSLFRRFLRDRMLQFRSNFGLPATEQALELIN